MRNAQTLLICLFAHIASSAWTLPTVASATIALYYSDDSVRLAMTTSNTCDDAGGADTPTGTKSTGSTAGGITLKCEATTLAVVAASQAFTDVTETAACAGANELVFVATIDLTTSNLASGTPAEIRACTDGITVTTSTSWYMDTLITDTNAAASTDIAMGILVTDVTISSATLVSSGLLTLNLGITSSKQGGGLVDGTTATIKNPNMLLKCAASTVCTVVDATELTIASSTGATSDSGTDGSSTATRTLVNADCTEGGSAITTLTDCSGAITIETLNDWYRDNQNAADVTEAQASVSVSYTAQAPSASPTSQPSPSPTPAPTPSPTPAPTPAPTAAKVTIASSNAQQTSILAGAAVSAAAFMMGL